MNGALRTMLATRDGLIPVTSGFTPQSSAAAKRLRAAVAAVAHGASGDRFAVPRPMQCQPLSPARQSTGFYRAESFTSHGPSGRLGPPLLEIPDIMGCGRTATDSRRQNVWSQADSRTVVSGQIAGEAHVSLGTVKTHLKRLFSKTGTHRKV